MKNKEEISVSFHFCERPKRGDAKDQALSPFTADEFDGVYKTLVDAKKLDIEDEDTLNRVRSKSVAPVTKLERVSPREICGTYLSSYFGHSFQNTEKGKISANSVNLRPFFFYLYLSKSGRIYIASQYLGNYGGYLQIRNTVHAGLGGSNQIEFKTFNVANLGLSNAEIKNVTVAFSRKSSSSVEGNAFGRQAAFTVTPGADQEGFRDSVLDALSKGAKGKEEKSIRSALTGLLKDGDLVELNDEDIDSCKLLIKEGKRKPRTLYLISGYNYATKFPLDVDKNGDGHPKYGPLKPSVRDILMNEIIVKKENV